ncbi:hypothetical protein GIB67_028033 [Kingdonia uniflora]|uniref:MULE transposase domain-containing protein n=1 Tax=Kingdonia uniflora TaxID=39325 RepID=A0A7J7NEJ2_9MAGN|nr:hypothetical protein GIB67_028033 [Kingdonia uniflora]
MQLRDEVGDDDSNPINVSDNAPVDCPPPEIHESHIFRPRHSYDLRHVFINYGGKWGRMSPTGWVDSDYKGGNSFKCTDDLRDMWAKGDESYPMRTQFYIKPTDVVREITGAEAEEYIIQDKDDNDYIISPKETEKKNTTPVKATSVKAIPVKTNVKRKGKVVVMGHSKPNKVANKPAKIQKKKEKIVMLSEEEGEDLDDLPEVYHSDKEIDPEEIDAYEIETPVNIVQESESECDDIDEEQERWVRCNEFENVDAELDDIYSKKEDDKAKTSLTVDFKEFEVGMQWATVYEAREHMRRNNDGHTMVLRHGNFQHSCEGKLGADNTLCNAPWVAREVEALVRDVRAMTPKSIKTRMKTQYGAEISYWTAWNARQICMESIVGSYDQGYHDLPSLCVEILKSNPGSIARTWRQDDTLQWTGKYGGVCLSVLSLDANNGLFPIGVYMCKTECKESWLDFLTKIEPYLSAYPGKLTFISNRQKGLIDSVAEIFPHANHRFCFRHMFKNIKKYYKGAHLERLSWGATRAFKQNEKQEFLNQLGIDIPGANDYLEKEPYEHWCRSHFDCTAKCEHITNNFSESFNWWIMKIRDKPLTKAFERLSLMLMKLMFERRTKAKSWDQGGLVPRVVKHLKYLMAHYGEYDMEGGDKSEWVSISSTGASKKTCKGEPIQIQSAPAPKVRGRPSQKSTKVYFNQSQQSGVTQVQTTPIVGGRGSSGRAFNAGRGRGRSEGASSGRASNTGRGRGRSECASSSSQSQERPPLVIPPMPLRTYAPTNPYKKTFKPPRQNWRL